MKNDEIKFFNTIMKHAILYKEGIWCNGSYNVREIINMLSEFINKKRCRYLLQKWSKIGFYNYGVTLDLGWIELNKIPERYLTLINKEKKNV